jgi:hypothetical protein
LNGSITKLLSITNERIVRVAGNVIARQRPGTANVGISISLQTENGDQVTHKLARIVYHVLTTKEPCKEEVFESSEAETLIRAESRLRKQSAQLGFTIAPAVKV